MRPPICAALLGLIAGYGCGASPGNRNGDVFAVEAAAGASNSSASPAAGAGAGGGGTAGAAAAAGVAGNDEAVGGSLNIAGAGEPPAPAPGDGAAEQGGVPPNSETGVLSITPEAGIWTSVRGLGNPPVLSFQIENLGTTELVVEAIEVVDSDLFTLSQVPPLPAAIAAGESVSVSVQLLTATNALPAAPPQNSGSTVVAGALSVTAGTASARARLHGILLTQAIWEPTFGQILDALGYAIDIPERLRTNANPNSMPGVEQGTDEIDAPLFVRAGPDDVSLKPVARFSPLGVMPFGFYTPGDANARTEVGAMDEQDDPHTSDKARIVLPPVTGDTQFDPGAAPFGIWAFSNQVAEGNPQNGDHLFTEDALNLTAGPHRVKVYPLADAAGTVIENTYLLACEEAANGDYQDYLFVLSNVAVAP